MKETSIKNKYKEVIEKHTNAPLANVVEEVTEAKVPIISEDDADYAKGWSEINKK